MRNLPILRSSKPLYPTASELYRARECIAPWALGLPEERTANEYAERGQWLHEHAAALARQAPDIDMEEALPQFKSYSASYMRIFEHVLETLNADLQEVGGTKASGPPHWYVEQGIRYRPGYPDVAKFVKREPGQRFEGWFSGTADLVYVRHDGVLVVADWKFGRKDQVEPIDGYSEDDDDGNMQLLFLALAFATYLGITGSSGSVVVARIELRFVSEDGIEVDGQDVTWGELCAFADELEVLAKRIDDGHNVEPRRSHACGRCKAREACPSWSALELALYAEALENATELLNGPPRDAEHAREYRDGIKALERTTADLEERYKAFLVQHPEGVPIGLGMREVGRKVERTNLVLTEAAQAMIREKWGDAAFASRPSIGRIRAVEKAKLTRPSKADWDKRKAAIAEEMKTDGLLLAPSVSTRAVVQQMRRDKKTGKDQWVDYRVESDEEGED